MTCCSFAEERPAAKSPSELSYPVTGTLYPFLLTKIGSQVSGKVQDVFVEVGDTVEKDQVLLTLDPVFFELEKKQQQVAVELAKVSYEEANLEFTRMKNLWNKEIGGTPSISKKQFDDAEARFKQKKLLLEQAEIQLEYCVKRLEETNIKAPYKGVITKRHVDPGESVTVMPAVELFEIIDPSKLILEFSLPQEMLEMVRPGLPISASIEGKKSFVEGKIDKVFPEVEIANRCFKCRVVINNIGYGLKPGSYVTAKIVLPERK